MDYQTLSYAVDAGVATIKLNRPESLNAMSPAMAKELHDAALAVDADASVRTRTLGSSIGQVTGESSSSRIAF